MSRSRGRVALVWILVATWLPAIGLPAAVEGATATASLTPADGRALDTFASSVAVSGNTVVVGAPNHDAGDDINSNEGAVYVYTKPASGWAAGTETAKLTASDAAAGNLLGWAVAISGDVIAASAIRANGNTGAIYLYVKPPGGWVSATENAKLTPSSGGVQDLGRSLAFDGDVIVAGAPSYDVGANLNVGAVYAFTRPAGGWTSGTESKRLEFASPIANAELGSSVALSGLNLVAGAPGEGFDKGAAYVFSAPLGNWSQAFLSAKLTASDGGFNDGFGTAVAIRGRTVAVGSPCDDDNAGTPCVGASGLQSFGSIYVFFEPFSGWANATQLARLTSSTPTSGARLGTSLAIGDDEIFSGVPGGSFLDPNGGIVYRFVRPAAGWVDGTEEGTVDGPGPQFGKSLAAAGHVLVVGSNAGLAGTATVVLIDALAPTTEVELTPASPDGADSWYLSPVHVTVTATDSGSGVASIRCEIDPAVPPTAFADLPNACPYSGAGADVGTQGLHMMYAASIDEAGNPSAVVSTAFQLDTTAPSTTITLSPAAPNGNASWYRTHVQVAVAATDGGSGVYETRCVLDAPAATFGDLASGCTYIAPGSLVEADGSHTIHAASRDVAGRAEGVGSTAFKIDATPPELACQAGSFLLGDPAAFVIADVSDATSGPSSPTVSASADTSSVGSKSVSLSGSDVAGNGSTVSCGYLVRYQFLGPFGLKSTYRLGSVIPVRFALADVDAVPITDTAAGQLTASCAVTVLIEGDTTSVCARYDDSTHEFVAPLRTSKADEPGPATIVVEVRAGGDVVNHRELTVNLR